jgi:hypothetical protein
MNVRISTACKVGKKMQTSRDKVGDSGDEVVNCTITVKGLRVSCDHMDELAGLPIGASRSLYNQINEPFQHMSFLLPKRELYAVGSIEHKRESGATIAKLDLPRAIAHSLRFTLFTPDDLGPTAILSFSLLWVAAGDEVDDVRDLLTHQCHAIFAFQEADKQMKLFSDSKPSAKADAEAGKRAKLERAVAKGQALAAEGIELIDKIQETSAAEAKPEVPTADDGKPIGPKFEAEVKARAAQRPRVERSAPGKR